jgi:hypothetical protein
VVNPFQEDSGSEASWRWGNGWATALAALEKQGETGFGRPKSPGEEAKETGREKALPQREKGSHGSVRCLIKTRLAVLAV